MLDVPEECLDLSPIQIGDAERFLAAAAAWDVKSHHYYFPRLLFGGQKKGRLLLFEEIGGSILIYVLRQRPQDGRLELRLYLPPFPFLTLALKQAMERMRSFNGARAACIDFVQDADASLLTHAGFATRPVERVFVYDRAAVAEAGGSAFKRLRQNLATLKKYPEFVAREFVAADETACAALYERFRAQLQAKGVKPKGSEVMAGCLKNATQLPASLMRAEVLEVGNSVRAYSFGGPINGRCGCVFLTVADHEFSGLAYALRHRMMAAFPELTLFNDSTDNGRSGLAEMKRRFRPVEMYPVHTAREVG